MFLTLLEYVLVRLLFGAARAVVRAVGLLVLLVLWALGAVLRLVGRPALREFAYGCGRLLGHARLASACTVWAGSANVAGRR